MYRGVSLYFFNNYLIKILSVLLKFIYKENQKMQ